MEPNPAALSLDHVPHQLWFSTLLTGEHECSCFVCWDSSSEDSSASGILTWTLAGPRDAGYALSGSRPLTHNERQAGRVFLACSCPPSWPDSRLSVEVQFGLRSLRGEWPVRHYQQHHVFRLPLDGQVFVAVGHRIGETHRRALEIPAQQFAWDFVPLASDGLRMLNGPLGVTLRAQDFAGFGAPVRAPAAGRVVEVVDGQPDLELAGDYPDPQALLANLWRAGGNAVVLDHDDGVWSYVAHLQCGSVCVREGQEVGTGAVLGALGNSGFSSGPHLHIHFMDGPDLLSAGPLPIVFTAEGGSFAPQVGQIIGPEE